MMQRKNFWLAILSIVLTYSVAMACDEDKKAMKALTGKWELVKTDCCGRTTKTSMAEPGEKVISFKSDGTMETTEHGKKQASTYQLTRNKTMDENLVMLSMGRETYPAMYHIDGDTLTLSWGYMDLQIEYYVKKK
jgi:uncharacterized protein (TIGR03067 family)